MNAPRSAHRLPLRHGAPLELAVFTAAVIGVLLAGARLWALVDAALVVVDTILLTLFGQWDE